MSAIINKLLLVFLCTFLCYGNSNAAETTPAWWTAPFEDTQEARATIAMEDVFSFGYNTIKEKYINDVDIPALVIKTFSELHNFDAALRVIFANKEEKIYITYHNEPVKTLRISMSDGLNTWTKATAVIAATILKTSPVLQELGPSGFCEIVFTSITSNLDNNSKYLSPTNSLQRKKDHLGEGQIGITLAKDKDGYKITDIDADYPCSLKIGNIITFIEGVEATSIPETELPFLLRGEAGSRLSVNIKYQAEPVSLTRYFKSTQAEDFLNIKDDFAIIKIENFNLGTTKKVEQAVSRLPKKTKAVIIDLIGSKGGVLSEAVGIADLFLEKGIILDVNGRSYKAKQHYEAGKFALWQGKPLFVAQDKNTVSAAEALSAALKDNARAVIIGTPSFGKGTVQTSSKLPNGGELMLTWAEMFTPSGKSINNDGIAPDICITEQQPCPKATIDSIDALLPLIKAEVSPR